MLDTTYDRIAKLFRDNNGYMCFNDLRDNYVTVSQMRELEQMGMIERFARGWYYAKGLYKTKPDKYRYIELKLAVPEAVFCGLSACYLNGIIDEEPECIYYVTDYTSRRNIDLSYPTRKFYHDLSLYDGMINVKKNKIVNLEYLNKEAAVKDCIHCRNKIEQEGYAEVISWLGSRSEKVYRDINEYMKELR